MHSFLGSTGKIQCLPFPRVGKLAELLLNGQCFECLFHIDFHIYHITGPGSTGTPRRRDHATPLPSPIAPVYCQNSALGEGLWLSKFRCACGAGYRVPDNAAGRKVRCKHCEALVPVPLQEAVVEVPLEVVEE